MRAYRTSSNYTSNSYNAGISKSNKTTITNNTGNGNNNRETYRTKTQYTQYTPTQTKKAKAKVEADRKADNLKRLNEMQYETPKFTGPVGSIYSGLFGKKTFEVNKSYFQKKVADQFINGKKSAYTNSPESFKKYMEDRGMGRVDALGRTISNNDNGGGGRDFVVEKNVGGKSILTTEKKIAKNEEAKKEYDARVTKKKGRRKNILTSARGVTKTAANYSLGKKTLLGQVV